MFFFCAQNFITVRYSFFLFFSVESFLPWIDGVQIVKPTEAIVIFRTYKYLGGAFLSPDDANTLETCLEKINKKIKKRSLNSVCSRSRTFSLKQSITEKRSAVLVHFSWVLLLLLFNMKPVTEVWRHETLQASTISAAPYIILQLKKKKKERKKEKKRKSTAPE